MDEDQEVPALFNHMQAVYKAMKENSEVVDVEGSQEHVYEGFLTRLVTDEVGLSVPYYSMTTRALKNMGAIKQLRRGGATTPSMWMILGEPTIEGFDSLGEEDTPQGRTTQFRQLSQQIRDLSGRISKLEKAVEEVR